MVLSEESHPQGIHRLLLAAVGVPGPAAILPDPAHRGYVHLDRHRLAYPLRSPEGLEEDLPAVAVPLLLLAIPMFYAVYCSQVSVLT